MAEREDAKTRRDRELGELLQELRVAITGVQVLFAFLLSMPFTPRFPVLDASQRRVYFAAVLATAVSSLLLIAPAANHRLLFREGMKEGLLKTANRVAIAGLMTLALGIGLSLYLVTTMVYQTDTAVLVSIGMGVLTFFVWFVLPRLLKEDNDRKG